MTCGIGVRLQHPFYRVLLIPDNVTRFGGYFTGTPRVEQLFNDTGTRFEGAGLCQDLIPTRRHRNVHAFEVKSRGVTFSPSASRHSVGFPEEKQYDTVVARSESTIATIISSLVCGYFILS